MPKLGVKALRARCEAQGVSTAGLLEKADLVAALVAHAAGGGGTADGLGSMEA